MDFLGNIPNKDSLMLLDVLYHRPNKYNDKTDCIDIIYKDLKTGEKHLKSILNPEIEIYFLKNEYRNYTYNKTHMEISKCDKHTCQFKNLPWYIAKQAGEAYTNELKRMIEEKRYRDISRIHSYPYVFGSDIPIDTFYRIMWHLNYENELNKPITKTYLDIEVDGINFVGMPTKGECPINAVSIVDDEGKTVYTFLLNNPDNPLIKEFLDDIDNFVVELHEMFDESYGYLDYKIYMYDDERDLITNTFRLINTLKRDYCLIYNGLGFDLPYIIERMKVLGMEPEQVISHPDFKYKEYNLHIDTKNFAIKNKSSSFKVSGYTKFIDQMILYAATRKGQMELRSNALNYVAQKELKDNKLDYTDEANIKTLPYVNYRKFVAYNIKDTLLQMGIERKVNDIENLYIRFSANCTSPDNIFKETVMLKSRAYYEYILQGYILGNNVNIFYPDTESGFTGAVKNKMPIYF